MKRKTVVCILHLFVIGLIFMSGCSTETDTKTSQPVTSEAETDTKATQPVTSEAETDTKTTQPVTSKMETDKKTSQVVVPETKTQTGAPQLVVPVATFEFEPVLEDEYVIHKFSVQNKGTAELAISKVKSG